MHNILTDTTGYTPGYRVEEHTMSPLEKYAAKKTLVEGLKNWVSGARKKTQSFLKDPKHQTSRRIAAGVAATGAGALLLKKLINN